MIKVLKPFLKFLFALLFWVGIWQIVAFSVGNSFLLPGVDDTFIALIEIISGEDFFISIVLTLLRVMCGLVIGIVLGILLAVVSHHSEFVYSIVSPIISIIKSTPVASFIIILWIMLSGDALSIFIAVLMVMPIIWQNLIEGYSSIDKSLLEVCNIFEFSFFKKMKLLIIPTLTRYLIPGIITASGLAWKSEIAAEIIAYVNHSIGQNINDAKFYMETPKVFAWTVVIITLSLAIEFTTKYLLKRIKKWALN